MSSHWVSVQPLKKTQQITDLQAKFCTHLAWRPHGYTLQISNRYWLKRKLRLRCLNGSRVDGSATLIRLSESCFRTTKKPASPRLF